MMSCCGTGTSYCRSGASPDTCLGRLALSILCAGNPSRSCRRAVRPALLLAILLSTTPARADDTLDLLLSHAATAPVTQPTTRPSPLVKPQQQPTLTGVITLSDGSTLSGPISTTPGKPLRIWVESEHQYVDMPLTEITRIDAAVLWERLEKEWHFISSGSDLKEYTGRTYPARELQFTFTLRNGRKIAGGTVAPLYIRKDGSSDDRLIVLPKRQKGDVGTTLPSLLYPKRVELTAQSTP